MSDFAQSRLVILLSTLLLTLGCAATTPSAAPEAELAKESVTEKSDSADQPVHQARAMLEPVYFDTDEAALRSDARRSLKDYASSIVEHPEWGVITIDGHCDERGTDHYNHDLGSRRAAAVERFLVKMGVPPERIATRSFGSEKPAVPGHSEAAWRYNRRSEFRAEVVASASL
jgi:peptidoglycan-associated lipoprotein